jgi:hypothetical protein
MYELTLRLFTYNYAQYYDKDAKNPKAVIRMPKICGYSGSVF